MVAFVALIFSCAWIFHSPEDSATLRLLAINPPDLPGEPLSLIGRLTLPAPPREILLFGDTALVGLNREGLCWVDLSDPSAPRLKRHDWTPCPIRMKRRGAFVYMASIRSGVSKWDFTNPEAPQLVGRYETPALAVDVETCGPWLAVASGDGGVVVARETRDGRFETVGRFDTGSYARGLVALDEKRLLATDSIDGAIYALRLRDGNPEVESRASAPYIFMDDAALLGAMAYVSARVQVSIIDYSRPRRPRGVGVIWRQPDDLVQRTVIIGKCLFVFRESDGTDLYDLRKPERPSYLAHSDTAIGLTALALYKGNLIATSWDGTLSVYTPTSALALLLARRSDD